MPTPTRKKAKKPVAKLQKFTVWTEQVNADMYTIRARSVEDAVKKTKTEWKKDWGSPTVTYVENEEGKRVYAEEY